MVVEGVCDEATSLVLGGLGWGCLRLAEDGDDGLRRFGVCQHLCLCCSLLLALHVGRLVRDR